MAKIPNATNIISFNQTYKYTVIHSKIMLNPKSVKENASIKEVAPPIVLVRIRGSMESLKEKPELPELPNGKILKESMALSAPTLQDGAIIYKLTWSYLIKLDKPEMATPKSLKIV